MKTFRLTGIPSSIRSQIRQQTYKVEAAAHRAVRPIRGISTSAQHQGVRDLFNKVRRSL